jgi:hypothetical protein
MRRVLSVRSALLVGPGPRAGGGRCRQTTVPSPTCSRVLGIAPAPMECPDPVLLVVILGVLFCALVFLANLVRNSRGEEVASQLCLLRFAFMLERLVRRSRAFGGHAEMPSACCIHLVLLGLLVALLGLLPRCALAASQMMQHAVGLTAAVGLFLAHFVQAWRAQPVSPPEGSLHTIPEQGERYCTGCNGARSCLCLQPPVCPLP